MRRALRLEWPAARLPVAPLLAMTAVALLAALPAGGAWWLLRGWAAGWILAVTLAVYGSVYFALCRVLGLSELGAWVGRLRRRKRG
jgi:hypothetical protein